MKVKFTILILIIVMASGCSNTNYITVKHIKPVNYKRQYNKKKDKRKKRVKYVKVKILKQSRPVKSSKSTKPREKESHEPDDTQNEADSTGTL